jgi:tRNA(fMet)-specific endonuclease VapC
MLGSVPVMPYDPGVVTEHAELLISVRKAGHPRGVHDLLIAATARATDRIIVTADASAFAGLPEVTIRSHR